MKLNELLRVRQAQQISHDSIVIPVLPLNARNVMSTTSSHKTYHKNAWYYNKWVKELRHQFSSLRKKLKCHPSPLILPTKSTPVSKH